MVHKHGPRLHAGKGTVGANSDSAQVIIIADTAKNNVCAGCRLPGCGRAFWRMARRVFRTPGSGLGGIAVVNRDGMTGQREVTCHRVTHDPKTDKGHF